MPRFFAFLNMGPTHVTPPRTLSPNQQAAEEERAREADARAAMGRALENESRYSRTNAVKLHNHWRHVMRLVKMEDVRREIRDVLAVNHARDVASKDATMRALHRTLDEAEAQHQSTAEAHVQMLDALMEVHDARVASLKADFDASLDIMARGFASDKKKMQEAHAMHTRALTCEKNDADLRCTAANTADQVDDPAGDFFPSRVARQVTVPCCDATVPRATHHTRATLRSSSTNRGGRR